MSVPTVIAPLLHAFGYGAVHCRDAAGLAFGGQAAYQVVQAGDGEFVVAPRPFHGSIMAREGGIRDHGGRAVGLFPGCKCRLWSRWSGVTTGTEPKPVLFQDKPSMLLRTWSRLPHIQLTLASFTVAAQKVYSSGGWVFSRRLLRRLA